MQRADLGAHAGKLAGWLALVVSLGPSAASAAAPDAQLTRNLLGVSHNVSNQTLLARHVFAYHHDTFAHRVVLVQN